MPETTPKLPRRKSLRLAGYDYRQVGAYYVTICTFKHTQLFGQIRNGHMFPNELGTIVHDTWQSSADKRPRVSLDAFVVMPNHLHGIILIGESCASNANLT